MDALKEWLREPQMLTRTGAYSKCMHPEFAQHLENYLPVFERYRAAIGAVPLPETWRDLPFGTREKSWKWRRESLLLLQKNTHGKTYGNVLEIGAWNGWLTKHLAQTAQTVIAADYFTQPYDGIGNIESLAPNIQALQCDLEQTGDLFKLGSFDLIVVNHCLSYTANPVAFVKRLIPLLARGGLLISLGNSFYRDPRKKIKENRIFTQRFRERYHLEVFIQPVKGFMDAHDRTVLKQSGFIIEPYPTRILQNILAALRGTSPQYAALIYQHRNV